MHHHSDIVRAQAIVPDDEAAAEAWLYRCEEALCDLVWQVLGGISPREPVRILDSGCGEGGSGARWCELARPRRLQTWGITLSAKQAEVARVNVPEGTIVCGDMLDPAQLAGSTFDAVVAIESTEYLGGDGLSRFFRRAHDWLAPDGCLIVVSGSWVGRPSEKLSAAIASFDDHYATALSSTEDYLAGTRDAGLRLVANLDLSAVALNYWRARIARPAFRNSPAAQVERVIAGALAKRIGEFRLYGWTVPA